MISTKLRTAVTVEEEETIISLINRYSSKGFPLCNDDMGDAVEILVSSMPKYRHEKLLFIINRPGKKVLYNFCQRHKDITRFKRCSNGEEIRWKSFNADVLTTYFAAIHRIIAEIAIDCCHSANLDETGVCPNRDCIGSTHKKEHVIRASASQKHSPEFRNIERVTLKPVVFAIGCVGRPLFIVNGKCLSFCVTMEHNSGSSVETLAYCLPSGSLITCREDVAGVDAQNVFERAEWFIRENERKLSQSKILLLLDGYQSHMRYKTLQMLSDANSIVYAFPSHTSGVTQPPDLSAFNVFKSKLRYLVDV